MLRWSWAAGIGLVAWSAGFSSVGTWYHWSGCVDLLIRVMQLEMYVKPSGGVVNITKLDFTVSEKLHSIHLDVSSRIGSYSSTASTAAQSSGRGMVMAGRGVNFDFAMTNPT